MTSYISIIMSHTIDSFSIVISFEVFFREFLNCFNLVWSFIRFFVCVNSNLILIYF